MLQFNFNLGPNFILLCLNLFPSVSVATFSLPITHVVCPSPTPSCLQFWILTIGSNFSWAFYSSQTNKVYSVCMGKANKVANYNSWKRGKCKLKSRIKLNCNIQACGYTAISRKVVGKNVHTTILKGNMGYDQHAVPDTVAVKSSIVAFL